ncbi:hypothetical protein RPD_2279 [Rhodopseudomonas palustris BisB5]|uniref:Uncharacterized protein n=1 Tax=Rhodopseudomonas palustris (strain BisB5) TaxID=316057 RepID=Q138H8_RHOPS|nr:hypothetical protein RPD_2279 [Rhodopseudomonas palustris BisB5]
MATAVQKITLSSSRDIPFNKLILSQTNVRTRKDGISIEDLAASIARLGLIQSIHVRPVLDADGAETGMFDVPAGGRLSMFTQTGPRFFTQTQAGFTAAMCIFDPMSIAAAPKLTGFKSGWLSVVVLGIASSIQS